MGELENLMTSRQHINSLHDQLKEPMKLYIKEWPDKSATITMESGLILFTFSSVESAKIACRDWYAVCSEERY